MIYRSYSNNSKARLNGGVLDGRALVADDRNRENVLTLRDIAPASQPPSRNPQVSTVSAATIGYFTTAPSPVYHNADGLPTSSFSGQENYEVYSHPFLTTSFSNAVSELEFSTAGNGQLRSAISSIFYSQFILPVSSNSRVY